MPRTPDLSRLTQTPTATWAEIGVVERRIEAAFPDRPALCVSIRETSPGLFSASVGKATRMRPFVRGVRGLAETEARIVAKLRAQDAE